MSIDALNLEYKELYQAELEHRSKLDGAIGFPVSLITAFSGIIYFFISKLTQPFSTMEICQLALFGIATVVILRAIFCLIRSFHNYQYQYVPSATDLDIYHKQKLEFHSADPDKENIAKNATMDHLYDSFLSSAGVNAKHNMQRSELLFQSKRNIIFVLFLCMALGFLHLISFVSFDQFVQYFETHVLCKEIV